MPWSCFGQTQAVFEAWHALAQRSNSKAARPEISRRLRKSRRLQLKGRRTRVNRHKRAPNVPKAVQPPILNLEREENPARPEHPANLRKSTILQLVRAQMMEHQNRNC